MLKYLDQLTLGLCLVVIVDGGLTAVLDQGIGCQFAKKTGPKGINRFYGICHTWKGNCAWWTVLLFFLLLLGREGIRGELFILAKPRCVLLHHDLTAWYFGTIGPGSAQIPQTKSRLFASNRRFCGDITDGYWSMGELVGELSDASQQVKSR